MPKPTSVSPTAVSPTAVSPTATSPKAANTAPGPASRNAGVFVFLYTCLVAHLTLFPYSSWRHIGIGAFEYLQGPWVPKHQSLLWGDIALNVLAYLPLGGLLMLALVRLPPLFAGLVAWLACTGLSLSLEALQTFLPPRVPSKMDVLTNSLGALLGILLMLLPWFRRRVLAHQQAPRQWLVQRAWLGLGTLALWFLSILPPHTPSFGTGLWLGNLLYSEATQDNTLPFGLPIELLLHIEDWAFQWINYCFLSCAWLLTLALTQTQAPRLRLLLTCVALTCTLRALDSLANTPASAWLYLAGLWLESNALGLLMALAVTSTLALTQLKPHQLALLGLVHVVAGWATTVLMPGIYDPTLSPYKPGLWGAFRYIQETGVMVSDLWPIMAITVLLLLTRQRA